MRIVSGGNRASTYGGRFTGTVELEMLAAKLAFLTEWLLADMAEEEKALLVPEVVRDDGDRRGRDSVEQRVAV